MNSFPVCPPDFLLMITTNGCLCLSLSLNSMSSSPLQRVSLSSEVFSFSFFLVFLKDEKAFFMANEATFGHLTSVGSRVNFLNFPKSHSISLSLHEPCLVLWHQMHRYDQNPTHKVLQIEPLVDVLQEHCLHWWQNF